MVGGRCSPADFGEMTEVMYETPISGHDDEYCHHSSKQLGGYRYRWVGVKKSGLMHHQSLFSRPTYVLTCMRPPISSHGDGTSFPYEIVCWVSVSLSKVGGAVVG